MKTRSLVLGVTLALAVNETTHSTAPPPPDLVDYLIQDVCTDQADRVTKDDPAVCSHHRNIKLGEPTPYIVTDKDKNSGRTYSATSSFPVRAANDSILVLVSKSLHGSFSPDFKFQFHSEHDGYDLIDPADGKYVSIIRTSDGGCRDQVFSSADAVSPTSGRTGGWILFPRQSPTTWQKTSTAHSTIFKIQITKDIPKCHDSRGQAFTIWTAPTLYTFESNKKLKAIRSDHFASPDLGVENNALERFYFTREYGYTRWEAWVPLKRCFAEKGQEAQGCRSLAEGNPLATRCSTLSDTPSQSTGVEAWGNQKWVRVDCRDQTNFIPLYQPQVLRDPSMARSGGLVDLTPYP